MLSPDSNIISRNGRPALSAGQTRDVDTAQHFLADHAGSIIVTFDHNAMDPKVTIYTATPEGVLSPGDYYLWPLLHQTSERLRREIDERVGPESRHIWYMDLRRLRKWQRRIPMLTTLIRIRKSAIQALCAWDLTNSRPGDSRTFRPGVIYRTPSMAMRMFEHAFPTEPTAKGGGKVDHLNGLTA